MAHEPVYGDAARNLMDFARRAAGSPVLVARGGLRGVGEPPVAGILAIESPSRRLVLVGEGLDAAYTHIDDSDVREAIASRDATLRADGQVIPLQGDVDACRPSADVLMLRVRHRRPDGSASGSVERTMLVVARAVAPSGRDA